MAVLNSYFLSAFRHLEGARVCGRETWQPLPDGAHASGVQQLSVPGSCGREKHCPAAPDL